MNEIFVRLKEKPELDNAIRSEIEDAFGPRGRKALAAIDAGKIKKYHDFVVVQGKTAEYVVEEEFCTCNDFMFRGRTCWHLLAVRIASVTGTYESVNRWYHEEMENTQR